MQIKLTLIFDTDTRMMKVDSSTPLHPNSCALLLSQIQTSLLMQSEQERALLINPLASDLGANVKKTS